VQEVEAGKEGEGAQESEGVEDSEGGDKSQEAGSRPYSGEEKDDEETPGREAIDGEAPPLNPVLSSVSVQLFRQRHHSP